MFDGLLMDHALGATTPETAAMIEALAQKDPGVLARLNEWRGITDLARRASADAPAALPEFPRQLNRSRRIGEMRRFTGWGLAMAACIVAGFFLGNIRPSLKPVTLAQAVQSPPVVVADIAGIGTGDFWTTARLRAFASQRSTPQAAPASPLWNQWLQTHHLGD
jgi:hypothetical protein